MNCKIEQLPLISAIYFALLQTGYEFYSLERDRRLNNIIESYAGTAAAPPFFSKVKQNTCEVYPYWPRAFILETAVFYLDNDLNGFRDYDSFQRRILSAANISAEEKDAFLWDWIADFPEALKQVIHSAAFDRYLRWETEWLSEQGSRYRDELRLLDRLLAVCRKNDHSSCQNIRVILCPVKCVYSSDHHIIDSSFIFTSGDLRIGSVIHEFLHTIVHPVIQHENSQKKKKRYPDIDDSYYLDGSQAGYENAFEEYSVRALTDLVMKQGNIPDVHTFLEQLANT